uniref:Uncharacterized protein n=1 Tax=Arcella intermedia TaxID=1963864 RepID=A0A6B2LW85_9EUKA
MGGFPGEGGTCGGGIKGTGGTTVGCSACCGVVGCSLGGSFCIFGRGVVGGVGTGSS